MTLIITFFFQVFPLKYFKYIILLCLILTCFCLICPLFFFSTGSSFLLLLSRLHGHPSFMGASQGVHMLLFLSPSFFYLFLISSPPLSSSLLPFLNLFPHLLCLLFWRLASSFLRLSSFLPPHPTPLPPSFPPSLPLCPLPFHSSVISVSFPIENIWYDGSQG